MIKILKKLKQNKKQSTKKVLGGLKK